MDIIKEDKTKGRNQKMGKNVTFREVPVISNAKELSQYLKPLYIIDNVLKSSEDYNYFQECTYNIIKGCFEHKECREYPVKFKFYATDKKTHTVEFRHFIVNMFAWSPFVNLYGIPGILDEDKQVLFRASGAEDGVDLHHLSRKRAEPRGDTLVIAHAHQHLYARRDDRLGSGDAESKLREQLAQGHRFQHNRFSAHVGAREDSRLRAERDAVALVGFVLLR